MGEYRELVSWNLLKRGANLIQIYMEEDKPVARGVIGTPFDVKPFQVSLFDDLQTTAEPHYTWECGTTYSKEEESTSTNPISGNRPLFHLDLSDADLLTQAS